jgi:transcriptional regulator GlxA family with amidase domain
MIRVAILAYEGVLQTTLGVTLDILALANRIAEALERPRESRFSVRVLGVKRRAVRTGAGHVFQADSTISACPGADADVVLVPGMNLPTPQLLVPALASREGGAASAWLRAQWLGGATIGASCTATFLLAETRLLDGRMATTSWFLAPLFRSRYPAIELRSELLLTRDSRLLCAGAAMAQADLVLAVVAEKLGLTVAQRCMRYLLLDERSSQAHYALLHQLADQDPGATRAEAWVRRHLAEDFSIADLARAVALGPRTLARRIERATGVSPIAFVQRIRVEAALNLLQTTALSFDEIATRVGYADPGALRRLLRRETGRGAREIRSKAA